MILLTRENKNKSEKKFEKKFEKKPELPRHDEIDNSDNKIKIGCAEYEIKKPFGSCFVNNRFIFNDIHNKQNKYKLKKTSSFISATCIHLK